MDAKRILTEVEHELDSWRARFDKARVKANLAKMEARDSVAPFIEEFELAYDHAIKRLAEASVEEFDALRKGLLAGWDELRRTYRENAPKL